MRRPLEVSTWYFPLAGGALGGPEIHSSTGLFDPTTGTYAWIESFFYGINPSIMTVLETIIKTKPGVRFDFDLEILTTGEHFHSHQMTTGGQGYPWQYPSLLYGTVIDADTFVSKLSGDVKITPRPYH